jgi:hypothetical protein
MMTKPNTDNIYSCDWVGFIYKLSGYGLISFVKSLNRRNKAKILKSAQLDLGKALKRPFSLNIVVKHPDALIYLLYILSRILVSKTGFGLVIGFINYS